LFLLGWRGRRGDSWNELEDGQPVRRLTIRALIVKTYKGTKRNGNIAEIGIGYVVVVGTSSTTHIIILAGARSSLQDD
jgi:hypothetical protein